MKLIKVDGHTLALLSTKQSAEALALASGGIGCPTACVAFYRGRWAVMTLAALRHLGLE